MKKEIIIVIIGSVIAGIFSIINSYVNKDNQNNNPTIEIKSKVISTGNNTTNTNIENQENNTYITQ